jgi:NADH dehydrogenase
MSKRKTAAIGTGVLAGVYAAWRMARRAQSARRNRDLPRGRSVLILGAGFAGTCTAAGLARLVPESADFRITLIDRRNYLLFTPMLPEVAGGELDPMDIVRPPRAISPRIRFLEGSVEDVDLREKRVSVRTGDAVRTMAADYIVIAVGSVTDFHGVPGVEERALTMKDLEDAQLLRNRLIGMLEQANAEPDPDRRRALLTFVVSGGGFTGVETIAAIKGFLREVVNRYHGISRDDIAAHVVHDGARLLPELDAGLADYARRKLEARGVQVHMGTKVAFAGDDFIELEGGRRIAARTLVWAAGVKPSPFVERLDCRRGRHGGIVVDSCCAVPGYDGIWAIGDCAEVPRPDGQGAYGPTAQNATREGLHVAGNVVAAMRGDPQKPFRHRTLGEMALIGKNDGVGEIYGVRFSGVAAWALWRLVYLSKMPGWRQRPRILLDWALDFAFGRETAAIPPQHAEASREQTVPAGGTGPVK